MFKSTRFRKFLLFAGLAAIQEEASVPEIMDLTSEESAHVLVGKNPGEDEMENFLKKHGLKIGGSYECMSTSQSPSSHTACSVFAKQVSRSVSQS